MSLAHHGLRRLHATLVIVPLLAACGGARDPPTVRATAYGKIEGVDDSTGSGTYSWKGVPFAKPPLGALRWKAPVEPGAWTATRAAKQFGNACLQNGRIYGPGSHNTYDATIAATLNTPVGSEDCLTLNIWRPASSDENLPVIFFIYGGSNISGYTADPVYDGAHLARSANAVVVTANYRVGILGFFDLPQLKTGDADDDSGNFAILDLIQVLKFIEANIARFGGDRGNVTVMGQSAGAINTWALLTSPSASGLFHKAIPLSGGISLGTELPAGSLPTLSPASAYQAQAHGLLAALLIADGKASDAASAQAYVATQTDAQIADYLRAQDASTLLTVLLANKLTGSGPIADGTVVPTDPVAAIAAGHYHKVPILAGNTAEEGKLFVNFLALSPALGGKPGFIISDATRFGMMFDYDPDATPTLTVADIIDPSYLPVDAPTTGYNARIQVLNGIFTTPSRKHVLDAVASQQPNVWFYLFAWAQEPAPWNDVYGAAHAFDLPFLFGNFGPSLFANAVNSTANEPGRLALSAAMMRAIASFVRSGDPNDASLGVRWEPWPRQLTFDATLADKKISVQ